MIILTTTFNCEKYIEKSLLSVMGQRFKDFTCYITDDMSTDNTVNIIKDLIKNDDRFILIENKIKKYQCGNYDQIIRELNIPDDKLKRISEFKSSIINNNL
jgi:glycosyltransferase involved in cell wall biosynthesis